MEDFIKKNYNKLFITYKNFCYKNYKRKLDTHTIEDLFQDSLIKAIHCNANINNEIVNYNAYLWMILRNDITNYLKSAPYREMYYQLDTDDLEIPNQDLQLPQYNYKDDFLINLEIALIPQLTQSEYHLFINFTMNKISLKDIAKYMGYSSQSIYQKNKILKEKIKNEIDGNRDKYLI